MPQQCVLTFTHPFSQYVPSLHIDGIEFPELVKLTIENRGEEGPLEEYSYATAEMVFSCNTVEAHLDRDREECLINGKSVAGILSYVEVTDKGKRATILQQMGPYELRRFPQGIQAISWSPLRMGQPYKARGLSYSELVKKHSSCYSGTFP